MNRMLVTSAALAALAFVAPATPALAQEKGTELGVGMLTFAQASCSGCSSQTTIVTGGGYVLAGFYLNSMVAIEPRLSVANSSGGGSNSTIWSIGVGVPFYLSKTWGHDGWFLEPGVRYTDYTCTGCSSSSQTSADAEVGYKVKLNTNAAMRIGAFYDYGFKSSNIPQTNTFGLELGLSAFLK